MPTNILLLPLLGGFWFLRTFHYTSLRSHRVDGYRLLIESALVGVVLFGLATAITVTIGAYGGLPQQQWHRLFPDVPYLGSAIGALLIGFVSPYFVNWFLDKTGWWTKEAARNKALSRHGNHLLRLLLEASSKEKPVSITLDSGKLYIGMVEFVPALESHDTYLGLVPLFSGHRDKETQMLKLDNEYLSIYEAENWKPEQFRIVLSVAHIRILSFFDRTTMDVFKIEAPAPNRPARTVQAS